MSELSDLIRRLQWGEITNDEFSAAMTQATSPAWMTAQIPRRWHTCKPASTGVIGDAQVERCACGAIRYDQRVWFDRNTRRKPRRWALEIKL